ncbi:putative Mitotic checkpoint serine/threonine-protein kinase BUB1 [Hypsibius exemplaris]|uniref:Mitotic checkpoint serine/threonine-protein kinase BUB1 n=1 Tax=Hypsibius exemplaris TaxID=2072580 RepID=A0A1W0X9B7_HYPEX|nr:putative Mitotic checkpoint serine/threonine-protein kinase BUB1 [Hypsibius exemplaris]
MIRRLSKTDFIPGRLRTVDRYSKMEESEDWDKTKENIRPLKQGRNITATTFADIVDPKASAELNERRAELDRAIVDYQGDDPLAGWVTLINWVEASYPKGGSQGGLPELLKTCCEHFWKEGRETKRYFDDERFVQIWCKYAAFANILVAFAFMHTNAIGSRFANFYISWAEELAMKDSNEAERVLELGIAACCDNSTDVAKLQAAKKNILDRDARSIIESGVFPSGSFDAEEERSMLGGLRPVGKEKKQAPINRVGANKIESKPIIRPGQSEPNSAKSNISVSSIRIHESIGNNEPLSGGDLFRSPDITSEFPPLLSEIGRENSHIELLTASKKARTSAAIPSRTPSLVSTPLAFQILSDPDISYQNLGIKLNPGRAGLDRRILSARPVEEERISAGETDWDVVDYHDPSPEVRVPQTQPEPEDVRAKQTAAGESAPGPQANQLFQWASEKFPSGWHEVSFEEGLAKHARKRCAAEMVARQQQQEETIHDRLRQAEIRLAEAEQARQAAEQLRAEAADEYNKGLEFRQEFEIERAQLLELREEDAQERLLWLEASRGDAVEKQTAEGLLQFLADGLADLANHILSSDGDCVPGLVNFGRQLRDKLEMVSVREDNPYHGGLLLGTEQFLAALEDRRPLVYRRRSTVFASQTNQTMQIGTESQFGLAIDIDQRMASTPKPVTVHHQVLCFDDEENRGEDEPPPQDENADPAAERDSDDEESVGEYETGEDGTEQTEENDGGNTDVSKPTAATRRSQYRRGLSPIAERSRESKASDSSESGSSTRLRITEKRSTQNCSPLHEELEHEGGPLDPYNSEKMAEFKLLFQDRFLLDPAVIQTDESSQKIVKGKTIIKMDGHRYKVEDHLGAGQYATVYSVRCRSDAAMAWALKVQVQEGWWDYYIHTEARRRIEALPDSGRYLAHIIGVQQFQRLKDGGSYCFLPLFDQGTIVDLINIFKRSNGDKNIPELLAMKLAVDILRAVEALHSVNIIHGDIKSDNFLLRSLKDLLDVKTPEEFLALPTAILTDFGCGIDMDLFPPAVTFSTLRKGKSTAGHDILQSKPWTFQIDYFGVLDVIHSLLFNDYMKVYEERGIWRISKSFKRNWSGIWAATFQRLLNVPSCQELPRLADIRQQFEEEAMRLLQSTDIERFARTIRVSVFMQRKSCFIAR